jgi:hypothetical protein
MARPQTKVCLQKTLKEGLRRCVYRRWEAEVRGQVLLTTTTELERLYRGNTPYALGRPIHARRLYVTRKLALAALLRAQSRRLINGYRPA